MGDSTAATKLHYHCLVQSLVPGGSDFATTLPELFAAMRSDRKRARVHRVKTIEFIQLVTDSNT
jgi:hypothetical protein